LGDVYLQLVTLSCVALDWMTTTTTTTTTIPFDHCLIVCFFRFVVLQSNRLDKKGINSK
jgi:hypothetical protein